MGRFIVFHLFIIYTTNCLHSQSLGLIEDDLAYSQLKQYSSTFSGSKDGELPSSYSLKDYTPYVKNQGNIESCSSWAVIYGAMTIDYAYRNSIDNRRRVTESAFMPLYIHNQLLGDKDDCSKAKTRIEDVLAFAKGNGAISFKEFNIDVENCDTILSSDVTKGLRKNFISEYYRLFDIKSISKVTTTKRAISDGRPVIIGFSVFKSFKELRRGKEVWHPGLKDVRIGSHAMVVVGYDDETQTFEFMNSWGPKWGRGGFVKVRYNDFEKYCKRAFVFTTSNDEIEIREGNSYIQIRFNVVNSKSNYNRLKNNDTFEITIENINNYCNYQIYSVQDEELTLLHKGDKDEETIELPGSGYGYKFNDDAKSKLLVVVGEIDKASDFKALHRKAKMKQFSIEESKITGLQTKFILEDDNCKSFYVLTLN